MIRRLLAIWFACLGSAAVAATPSIAGSTTPLQFFQSYVRQIAAFEDLRSDAERELAADNSKAPMACVHAGARYDLEVNAAIHALRNTHLDVANSELQKVPQLFADVYTERQQTMGQLTRVCTIFAAGPKPGVDYSTLVTEMPKLRAKLDYLDKTLFDGSPLVFSVLISDVPDSAGHASHLVISCEDRKRLVNQIDASFGSKLDSKDGNYNVSQAQVFRLKLLEFKCAEEAR